MGAYRREVANFGRPSNSLTRAVSSMIDPLKRSDGSVSQPSVSFFLAVGVLVAGLSVLLTLPGLDTAAHDLSDTDGYMRFVRVSELRTGHAAWFESFESRSNAPFGHSMHWTRPLDVVLITLSTALQPFLELPDALYGAAVMVGPLLFGILGAVVAWAAVPLVGRVGGLVAGLGVVLQPGLASYGGAGRVDHHGLIFVVAAVLVGLMIRLALTPRRELAVALGATAAVGVWVSTEFLLLAGLALLIACVGWVARGAPVSAAARTAGGAWLIGLGVALVVERGWVGIEVPELDRISWVHLLVGLLTAAFWVAAARWGADRPVRRMAQGVVAGVAGLVVLALLEPGFLSGPFGDVPAELWEGWLGGVAELQPLWPIGSGFERSLYLLSAPVLGIGLAVLAARRQSHPAVWWAIAAVIAVTTGLALSQLRFSTYPQLLATLPWAWLAATLVARTGATASAWASLSRVGAMLVGVGGFLVPVLAVEMVSGDEGPSTLAASECRVDSIVELARQEDVPIVLAHIDYGPEILYRSDARVVAAPYHRNVEGILDARRFMLAGESEAARIASDREIDLVFVCPSRDRGYLGSAADEPESMYSLLVSGVRPGWLQPLDTPDDLLAFAVNLTG